MISLQTRQAHSQSIADRALKLGFSRAAFCDAERFERGDQAWRHWLQAGREGVMDYLGSHHDRADPNTVLPNAKSVIVVALTYGSRNSDGSSGSVSSNQPHGKVARYAQGADYHLVLKKKLNALGNYIEEIWPDPVSWRACVDSAPILEHEAAARSGLGFIGKNTLTIIPGTGSYVLLGELVVDVELTAGSPSPTKCGDCTACLDRCPTKAFVGPYVLDARRCISYLTIEHRGFIDHALRPLMGTMIFGCDICQEVCPFNKKEREGSEELAARPELQTPDLLRWLTMGSAQHKRLVKGTALSRASRNQLARNAAIALGNLGDRSAVGPLVETSLTHPSPLVRGHAYWAISKLGGIDLIDTGHRDPDPQAQAELETARKSR